MRVAVAQTRSTENIWENLSLVQAFTEEAHSLGAELVCFPENILFRGRKSLLSSEGILARSAGGEIETGASSFARELGDWLRSLKIALSLGSVLELDRLSSKPFNSHWIFRPNAPLISYHKIHLFSFRQGDVVYQESTDVSSGERECTAEIHDFRAGLSVCYDLRFPELYRRMVLNHGANLLMVPAAFTFETGRAHWHTLLRARAIESLSYVVASAQWGSHFNEKGQELKCYGHSLIVDPWGEILAEGPEEGDALLVADLDMNRVTQVRKQLPALDDVKLW